MAIADGEYVVMTNDDATAEAMTNGRDEHWVDDMHGIGPMVPALRAVDRVEYVPKAQRQFLPTLSDLVDRLTIVQQKAIFIPERKAEYLEERAAIMHDIDLIIAGKQVTAADIHAIIVIQLTNRFIWENESKARLGGSEQDKLLKLTHSINGVRNAAKNELARLDGGRKDYKIDALAAELTAEFGDWKVF